MKKNLIYFLFIVLTFFKLESAIVNEEQLVAPIQTTSAISQEQLEIDVFNLINQTRTAHFLPILTWSAAAATQARNHSLNMANKLVPFGHQGAEQRFATLRSLIPFLTRFGENVAYNRGYLNPVQIAVSGWLSSPGHYANIVGDFNLTGVGVAKNIQGEYYFTQIFVKAIPTLSKTLEIEEEGDQEVLGQTYECISERPLLIELNN